LRPPPPILPVGERKLVEEPGDGTRGTGDPIGEVIGGIIVNEEVVYAELFSGIVRGWLASKDCCWIPIELRI